MEKTLGRTLSVTLVSGAFLVICTFFWSENALETTLVPLHVALLGVLTAILIAALDRGRRARIEIAVGILLGLLLSLLVGSESFAAMAFWMGWPVLLVLALWRVYFPSIRNSWSGEEGVKS